MRDRDRSRLQDIIDYARRAAHFLGDAEAEALEHDDQLFSAVLWCMVVIGEAATHLAEVRLGADAETALQEARRMRNMLIHRYPEIDAARVVATIRDDLPPLVAELETLLREPSQ